MKLNCFFACFVLLQTLFALSTIRAEVLSAAPSGFQIAIQKTTSASAEEVFKAMISDFSKWWDPAHSYSGRPENLSMDLEKGCLLEKLTHGGFVRHLEIVYYEPSKKLRLTGGLGPLQELGIHGALTFELAESDEATEIKLTYNVVGFEGLQLDKIAAAVNRVLEEQADRLKEHCDGEDEHEGN